MNAKMSRAVVLVWGACVLAGMAMPAAASNSIFLEAAGASGPIEVTPGQTITLELWMDFLDETVGGGVALQIDAGLLRLDSVGIDPGLGDDPVLRCYPGQAAPPPACTAQPPVIAFGALTGLVGRRRVATLELTGLAAGAASPAVSEAHRFSDEVGDGLSVLFVPEPGVGLQIAGSISWLTWLGSRRRRSAPGIA